MNGYRITLYDGDAAEDSIIWPSFYLPTLPYPGLRIIHNGAWEVMRVQVAIAQQGSFSARHDEPPRVDVVVVASTGIHSE